MHLVGCTLEIYVDTERYVICTLEIYVDTERYVICTLEIYVDTERYVICTNFRTNSNFILYNIKFLVFVTEAESVYCAVRIESLHKTLGFVF